MYPRSSLSALARTLTPWCLLSIRVWMVPFLIAAPAWLSDRVMLWFYVIAFVTDYFDGVVARALKTAGPALRKADSSADMLFQLATASLILRHHPDLFQHSAVALGVFLATSVVWYTLDAIRWHRVAGFHAYSAKLFSCGLLVWMVLFLSGVRTTWLLSGVLIYGGISNVEGILISLRLRRDCCDVPTVFHVPAINRLN